MFSLVFGIPLSFGALLTGLALGLGTRWGVFTYPWVVGKLASSSRSCSSEGWSSRRPAARCSTATQIRLAG
jgi:hypothetical protein